MTDKKRVLIFNEKIQFYIKIHVKCTMENNILKTG